MYHSITFTDENGVSKNTWDDWKLIPNSRPFISPPDVAFNIVNVPWSDTILDLTQLSFGSRKGGFVFLVTREADYIVWKDLEPYTWKFLEDYEIGELPNLSRSGIIYTQRSWLETYNMIRSFLEGHEMKLILEDDPTMFYKGRIWAEKWETKPSYSEVTINYDLEPYKRSIDDPTIYSL